MAARRRAQRSRVASSVFVWLKAVSQGGAKNATAPPGEGVGGSQLSSLLPRAKTEARGGVFFWRGTAAKGPSQKGA